MGLRKEHRIPTSEEYLQMRKSVGWPLYPPDVTARALSKSLFAVCVFSGDEMVGMGRVLGDGGIYFHLQDVIVHPEFQSRGVGKMIVTDLLAYVDRHTVTNSNIGLMCSKGREKFYERFGFVARPAEKYGAGMIKIVD